MLGGVVAALVLFTVGAGGVSGHGGRTLIVEPQIVPAGAEINIHATFLWSDETVRLRLLAIDGTSWPLGSTTTDGNGSMEVRVRVPEGLPDATYLIVGTASSGDDAHVELVVRSPVPVIPIVLGVLVAGFALGSGLVALRRRRHATTGETAA